MSTGHFNPKSLDALVTKLCSILSEEQIEALARETGFVQRNSKITARAFLQFLLFDHLQYALPSLQQHALSLYDNSGQPVSKQAVDRRFNEKALLFVAKLFETFLSQQLTDEHLPNHLSHHFKSVKVMDSTEFKLPDHFAEDFPGYSACNALACAAIQLEYDVLSRKIHCLSLSSARESDKTVADYRMNCIELGDLILRDLGYYRTDSYLKIEQRNASYISRLKAQVAIYQKNASGYEALSWSDILEKIQKNGDESFDKWVYIGKEQKHPVRLIAWILPEEEQQKRLRKKQSKKGVIRKEDMIWSRLNVFITNISCDKIDAQQIYHLYKIRWQIELMFKIWKSILNIDAVRKMKTSRLKCYLFSKLIWVLMCWDITGMVESVSWKSNNKLISPYKCMAILKTKAMELKRILFDSRRLLRKWLIKITEVLTVYGWKENRKNKMRLSNLLGLK